MAVEAIVKQLIAERDKLDKAIRALTGDGHDSPSPLSTKAVTVSTPRKKRKLSAAGRARIAAAAKARWAKVKAAKKGTK